jgi:hypothetical protein
MPERRPAMIRTERIARMKRDLQHMEQPEGEAQP